MPHVAKFTILIPFLGALTALGPLSNDLYVPSLSLVANGLQVGDGPVQLTMSSLLIGFALGALIYGPLSDRYGRKPILCFGLAIYVAAGALSALSTDLAFLIAARSLQGLGAASGMVLARAIILDRWVGEQASRAMSWVVMFTFFTPVIAPVVGGYVASLGHWPAVFWLQAGAGALCMVITAVALERTHRAPSITVRQSVTAYGAILRDPQALGYMLCMGLAFIGVVAFVSNSSFVLVGHFGLLPRQYGYCFSFVMLGGSIGAYINSRYVARLGISRMIGFGTMMLALGGSAALISPMLGGGLFSILLSVLVYVFGIGFVFANIVARTISRFRESTGAASSILGVNQFLVGAIVAAVLSTIREPSPMPMVSALALGGLSSAVVWWLWLGRSAPLTD